MFEDLDIDFAACNDPAAYGIDSQGNPQNEEISKIQETLTCQGNTWYEQPYRPTQNLPTPSHLKSTDPVDASPAAVIFDMNLGVDSIDSHEYPYSCLSPNLAARMARTAQLEPQPDDACIFRSQTNANLVPSGQLLMPPYYSPKQIMQQRSGTPKSTLRIRSTSHESTLDSTSKLDWYLPTQDTMPPKPSHEILPLKATRLRVPPKQWEEQRPDIEEYYINQGKSLSLTMSLVSEKYGNHAAESTFKKKFKEWGLSKNSKRDTEPNAYTESAGNENNRVKNLRGGSSEEDFSGGDEQV
ncbi:hypothetical protein MMC14_005695 [Varicellaria rhodocarpa]|nr:hypothetical protein [Varicellaria rhodocarpa]